MDPAEDSKSGDLTIDCLDGNLTCPRHHIISSGGNLSREIRHDRDSSGWYLNARRYRKSLVRSFLYVVISLLNHKKATGKMKYPKLYLPESEYPSLLGFMREDQCSRDFIFTLLNNIGGFKNDTLEDLLETEHRFREQKTAVSSLCRILILRLVLSKPILTYRLLTYKLIWPLIFHQTSLNVENLMKKTGQIVFAASFTMAEFDGAELLSLGREGVTKEVGIFLSRTIVDPNVRDAEEKYWMQK